MDLILYSGGSNFVLEPIVCVANYGSPVYHKVVLFSMVIRRYCSDTGKVRICRISLYSRVSQILPKYRIYPTLHPKGLGPGPEPWPGWGVGPLGWGGGVYGEYVGYPRINTNKAISSCASARIVV